MLTLFVSEGLTADTYITLLKCSNLPPEVQQLLKLSGQGVDLDSWLISAESSIDFLQENVRADRLVLYASLPHVLIHAVLAPLKQLKTPDQRELSNGFVAPDASWRIEHVSGGGQRDRVYLAPPLSQDGMTTLKGGEKLIFRRSGPREDRAYTEISQKLVHALELHYVDERNAYSRIDEHGDIEDIISIFDEPNEQRHKSVLVITIKRQDFYEYARLASMGLVFFFLFCRYRHQGYDADRSGREPFEHRDLHLFYNGAVKCGQNGYSYVRGCQIVFPPVTKGEIVKRYEQRRNRKDKDYAVFKALDLKTKEFIEVSCDPAKLPSSLELSPVFFDPEVLHKYKSDPSKYELGNRTIECKGTWFLPSYDYEDGLINAYLCDLGNLPYKEQEYWKLFNKTPKGGRLSQRAISNDFLCRPDYDPLSEVKQKIECLNKQPPAWWKPRGQGIARLVHYPLTKSTEEWSEAILRFDHLLVEGFNQKPLEEMAADMGRSPEKNWGSLKLVEECLLGKDFTEEQAKEAMEPLRKLHHLRTTLKAHLKPHEKENERKQALKDHGSFQSHFEALATDCDKALHLIMVTLGFSGEVKVASS